MPLSDPETALFTRAREYIDMASDMELFVWLPCEKCGRLARLHLQRELKPVH